MTDTTFRDTITAIHKAAEAWPRNGQSHGGATRAGLLAIAWVEEIQAAYDEILTTASPGNRALYDLAIEMCKEAHCRFAGDETHKTIHAPNLGPPVYSVVKRSGIYDPWNEPTNHAVAVQYMLGGARPLWTHYITLAQSKIASDTAHENDILARAEAIKQRRTAEELAAHQLHVKEQSNA